MPADFSDPPFAAPPDIVLELPAPLSVNRTRRIDWKAYPKVKAWIKQADALFLMQKRKLAPAIKGRYEIIITLRDGSAIDADNTLKVLCDFVHRVNLVSDDSPAFMRRVTIEFGTVDGCRVTVRPVG